MIKSNSLCPSAIYLYDIMIIYIKSVISLLAVPRRLFYFGSLVILDMARCYLWLFSLYMNIK